MAGLSYFHAPGKAPRVYRTIASLLDEHAASTPDKTAHVFWTRDHLDSDIRRQQLSFRQLADDSSRLASGLLELGINTGDRIAIYGSASPQWIQMDLACLRIGVLAIGLPQTLVYSENLGRFLKDHKCRILVLEPRPDRNIFERITDNSSVSPLGMIRTSKLHGTTPDAGLELVISTCRVPGYDDVMLVSDVYQCARDDLTHVKNIQDLIDPEDIALVNATSGSTGVPKLVANSQFGLVSAYTNSFKVGVLFNDRLFSWVGSVCHFPSIVGATHVHVESPFTSNPDNITRLFQIWHNEAITTLSLTGFLAHDVVVALEDGRTHMPASVVAIITGGEKLDQRIRQKILDGQIAQVVTYGSTEAGLVCADRALPGELLSSDVDPPTLALSDDTEVKVTDKAGRVIPLGEIGDLWVRGSGCFLKYLDDEVQTNLIKSPAGWTNTGDLASLDSSGNIRLYGRASDIISKGSVKVYPSTIEALIKRHTDVETAYVTGIHDAKYHEEIGACVIPKTGCDVSVEQLRSFCEDSLDRSSGISLVPKYILIVSKLPLLPTLKVDRQQVKSMLQKLKESKIITK